MRKVAAGLLVFFLLTAAVSTYVFLTIGSPYVAGFLRRAAQKAETSGFPDSAEKFYRYALSIDSCDTDTRIALALLYEGQDRFSAAQALLQAGIDQYPDTAGLYLALARLYIRADMPVRAAELLDSADNPYAALTISGKRPEINATLQSGEYLYLPDLAFETEYDGTCFYEIDGVWREYTGPFRLDSGSPTVRALAVSADGIPSRIKTWHYTVSAAEAVTSIETHVCCPHCGAVFSIR